MDNMIEEFFEKYKGLPSQEDRICRSRYYRHAISDAYFGAKMEWPVKTKDISILVENGGSDFILKALVFSLFSKILFVYSRENYIYCKDYLFSKFDENLLSKLYKAKFKNLADSHWFNGINDLEWDKYIVFLIDLFYYFNARCTQLDFLKLMENIFNLAYFREEFSLSKNCLSSKFIEGLGHKLFKIDTNIFNCLYPIQSKIVGNSKLIEKLSYQIKFNNVCFYPSSGIDLDDLKYVNYKIEEFKYLRPKIFIHVDFYCNNELTNLLTTIRYYGIEIIEYQKINTTTDKEICVFELKKKSEMDNFFFIHFGGYFNEEILKILIKNKISIPVIYAFCDGIDFGMGACNLESVPTIFYPFFKEYLNLKYIITDQSKYRVREIMFGDRNNFRISQIEMVKDWLKNLNKLINDKNLTEWLTYSDVYLLENIFQYLEGFNEKILNEGKELNLVRDSCSSLKFILKELT
jgi:hypothetical protein